MHYYGTRLSENISKREPEGYLLCLNVPVARTGTQEYLAEELGLTNAEFYDRRDQSSCRNFDGCNMATVFRNLNCRDCPPGSSLVSVDLSSDEISATGSPQSFAQIKDLDSCST